jgi:hypothetical protein
MGREEDARQRLLECRAEAEAIGSQRVLWRVLKELSQIEPDPVEAERLCSASRQIVESFAENIDQDDLRRSFLEQPEVRQVFERTEATEAK